MKPKLVLHICCAPDEAYVLQSLSATYELTSFFCNPNISPLSEYELRLAEAQKTADHFHVPFSYDRYAPETWENAVVGYETTGEGRDRCRQCFMLRLNRTAAYCKSIGWPSFTTVMSVSPFKNILLLNECGSAAALNHNVIYEPFNFKKNDGFLKSVRLSEELGLYRQDYCGCRLSREEAALRKSKKMETSNHCNRR